MPASNKTDGVPALWAPAGKTGGSMSAYKGLGGVGPRGRVS